MSDIHKVALFYLGIIGFAASFTHEKICIQSSPIVKIGGCNEDGLCGVSLEDGSYDTDTYPVIGKKVCQKTYRKYWYE